MGNTKPFLFFLGKYFVAPLLFLVVFSYAFASGKERIFVAGEKKRIGQEISNVKEKAEKYSSDGGGSSFVAEIKTAESYLNDGKYLEASETVGELEIKIGIEISKLSKSKAEKKKAEEAKKAADAKKKAEEEARKAAEAKRLAEAKKRQAVTAKPVTAVAKGSCARNEYYVVVNVNTNTEQIYKGDPDCRTGAVLETRRVATGRHENIWNPGGWWYWGGTPTGKWKIIRKEKTSGQFGPWFLRLHYLAGGYVDQYALHGTNEPSSIGNWASSGCIRHYNGDIEHLAAILPVGTVVWTIK